MKIHYIKTDAAGNTTAIVTDAVSRELYAKIGTAIIADESAGIEQVGFMEKPANKTSRSRLQMMGDEFCANALRSFAAYLLLSDKYAPTTGMIKVPVEISGNEGTTNVLIIPGDKKSCVAVAEMPLPKNIYHTDNKYLGKVSVVEYEGIVHIVMWDAITPEPRLIIPAKEILKSYNIESPCIGLMFFDRVKKSLTPIVFVEATKTAIKASSCGSGTAAVVCALSSMLCSVIPDLPIAQPGGILRSSATFDGKNIINCSLTGEIFICGEYEIDLEI